MDWKNPNYTEIVRARMARLKWLREDKSRIATVRAHYLDAPTRPHL